MSNIARKLVENAKQYATQIAIAEAIPKRSPHKERYRTITFAELDELSDKIAAALIRSGVKPEMRITLMVRQGVDFIALVFGIFKSGATLVLIDPGMGLKQMIRCLAEVRLDGFAAISPVQAARCFLRNRFPLAKHNLTVGRRWFWGGLTLDTIRKSPHTGLVMIPRESTDPAAIVFTSGSTGVAKGVLFTHGMFQAQIEQIQNRFEIKPGDIDLACFPFFGLFNAAFGVTAIIPDMDSARPASVDPRNILEAIADWNVNQSFASPAVWNPVCDYCLEKGVKMESLRRAVSAGAPVSAKLLDKLKRCIHPDGEIYTPYGATEALPVALISATEVLGETVIQTNQGGGICVGTRFGEIQWKIIRISDKPIARLDDAPECPVGEIGELAVCGPQVTTQYVTRLEVNALAKMSDSQGRIWHRMGDVGYLDKHDRFWFCGRKAHRVETESGTLFSIPCESIFNQHPRVSRSALAGIPTKTPSCDAPQNSVKTSDESHPIRTPVMFIELFPNQKPKSKQDEQNLLDELRQLGRENPITASIKHILFYDAFPVDVRHNAKINREQLSEIAETLLGRKST